MARHSDDRSLRSAMVTALGGAAAATVGGAAAGRAVYQLLLGQARAARTVIPQPTADPPFADGLYPPDGGDPTSLRHALPADALTLYMYGDSTAAGQGCATPEELPGVITARLLAADTGRPIAFHSKAVVGATSLGLGGQIEASLITTGPPDVAVILIGGNDVTAQNGIGASAKRLGAAVRILKDAGSAVVVATCPDLGIIHPVKQPLRQVLHQWSVRLASAQRAEVLKAGGRVVALHETLTEDFLAHPEDMFSDDNFHPSPLGYRMAAELLMPAVAAELGLWEHGDDPMEHPEGPYLAPTT